MVKLLWIHWPEDFPQVVLFPFSCYFRILQSNSVHNKWTYLVEVSDPVSFVVYLDLCMLLTQICSRKAYR